MARAVWWESATMSQWGPWTKPLVTGAWGEAPKSEKYLKLSEQYCALDLTI